MKKKQVIWMFMLVLVLFAAACSNNDQADEGAATPPTSTGQPSKEGNDSGNGREELDQVHLIWHYFGPEQQDIQAVQDAVNAIALEKINATVELRAGSYDFQQKMNPIVASGEEFDLTWTSNWHFNYTQNVRRGAFLPLSELIDEYAPKLKEILPQVAFDSAKVDGDIYAIPNYQSFANQAGFMIRQRVMDVYPLDIDSIQSLADITPYYQTLKEADLTPIFTEWRKEQGLPTAGIVSGYNTSGAFSHFIFHYGLEELGNGVAAVYHKDENLQIVNMFETPEYEAYLKQVKEWRDAGYIHPDAAIEIPDNVDLAVTSHNVLKPGGEERNPYVNNMASDRVQYVPISEAFVPNGAPMNTATAISRTSKNPERAMMLLELINTDPELYNLISYGIEGRHYERIDEQYIRTIPDSGYSPNTNWVFGNTFNEYLTEGMSPTVHKETLEQNQNALPSAVTGFVFNPEPVQTEIANVTSIIGEYQKGLETGTLDYTQYLPELQNRLNNAGAKRIVEEMQRQVDEWRAR